MPALALVRLPTLDVHLRTHLDNPCLGLRDITRFAGDGGFRARVVARSGGFSVDRPFFFEAAALARFLDDVRVLEKPAPGFARLRASDGPDVLGLELHARGDVTVFGALHEQVRVTQVLRFAFSTDQTVLAPLREDLERAWGLPGF